MLTSYFVRCPHLGCDFAGSLLPSRDTDSWRSSIPTANVAAFDCPHCNQSWKARVVGDDVVNLPVDSLPAAPVG